MNELNGQVKTRIRINVMLPDDENTDGSLSYGKYRSRTYLIDQDYSVSVEQAAARVRKIRELNPDSEFIGTFQIAL